MDGPNSLAWRGRFHHFLIVTARHGQTRIGVATMDGDGAGDGITPATRATNPFAETVTGELQFATPLGSPWPVAPRTVVLSTPPGDTQTHTLGIAYDGDPKEEDTGQWQARCIASLKVGKKLVGLLLGAGFAACAVTGTRR